LQACNVVAAQTFDFEQHESGALLAVQFRQQLLKKRSLFGRFQVIQRSGQGLERAVDERHTAGGEEVFDPGQAAVVAHFAARDLIEPTS
jgi:hypothetical protein